MNMNALCQLTAFQRRVLLSAVEQTALPPARNASNWRRAADWLVAYGYADRADGGIRAKAWVQVPA